MLPRTEELLDHVHSARVFTKIDLWHGYHQLRIAPEDVEKTAFRTCYGYFEYKVVCFGLANAPAAFQALMNDIFRELLDVCIVVNMDGYILVFNKSLAEHLVHLRKVLTILRKDSLYAKPSKCEFAKGQFDYLGFLVSQGEVRPHPNKILAIQDWPVPKTQTEVCSFLGLCSYYRQFINQFAEFAAPLSDLTKGPTMGAWNDRAQWGYERLKSALTSHPALHLADPTRPFTVDIDASDVRIGGVLHQKDLSTDSDYAVSYYFQVLSPAERNYPTHEREYLAFRTSFGKW